MATFQRVISSIQGPRPSLERRQELIGEIESLTSRPLLVYVADPKKPRSFLQLEDKTGFSDLIEDIHAEKVDVLINSPGGFIEVAEAVVGMLRDRFAHIRFAIPNIAKSAATVLVLSGDKLLMDHRSELGPIDPQVEYPTRDGKKREAADDILRGFDQAKASLAKEGPAVIPAYVPLLDKYTIGLLQGCENAKALSEALAKEWLKRYMFRNEYRSRKPSRIAKFLANRRRTLSHTRAIRIDRCFELGLEIEDLRKPEKRELADKLWELWCVYELHFERSAVYKIYENSHGCSLQKQAAIVQLAPSPPAPSQPQQSPSP